jgi:hypothetical protein
MHVLYKQGNKMKGGIVLWRHKYTSY